MIVDKDHIIDYIVDSSTCSYGIIGNGGGRKTFLTQRITESLGYSENAILCSDDYLLDNIIRKAPYFIKNYTVYNKESYFITALERDLISALKGNSFLKLPNDYNSCENYEPKNVKIFEGIALPFTTIFQKLDKKIFIFNDAELELELRIKRDVEERKIPRDKMLNDFYRRREGFENNYREFISDCDIVIKNMGCLFDVSKVWSHMIVVKTKYDIVKYVKLEYFEKID